MLSFFISIGISFLISFLFTPLVRNFFIQRRWVEDPHQKNQKTHNATAISIVPRGGGISIFVAILITTLFLLPLDKHLVGILLASLIGLIIGVWDDIKDISPIFRLFANIFIALIVVGSGIGIAYI